MTDAWTQITALSEKHSNGNAFIRLTNNGDKVVGIFCGDPHAREVHWTGEAFEECQGKGCERCAARERANLRVALNFFVPSENTMRIMEGGARWYKDVVKVRTKYGLDAYAFEIERRGDAGDPKTTYSILPDKPIDDAMRTRLAAVPLHDLGSAKAAVTPATSPAPQSATVSFEVAKELAGQLRELNKEDVTEFLKMFQISRVSMLPAADEEQARLFIVERQGGLL